MNMRRNSGWFGVVAFSALSACTKPNPAYCEQDCPKTADGGPPDSGQVCEIDDDCPTAMGICDREQHGCRTCIWPNECAQRSDGLTRCDPRSGACVACISSDDCHPDVPVCGEDRTCQPCTDNAQCASREASMSVGVCDRGACPAPDEVVMVDDDCGSMADGSPDRPFCEIEDALAAAKPIVVNPGSYRRVVIHSGTVRVIGKPEAIVGKGDPDEARLDVAGEGTDVAILGLTLTGATDESGKGVACYDGARLSLERVTISYNTIGVHAEQSPLLDLRRSQVHHNGAGGVRLSFTDFVLVNNLIWNNGTLISDHGGVSLGASFTISGTRSFRHNTLYHNHAKSSPGSAGGVSCQAATSLVAVILWDDDPLEVTENCVVEESVVDDDALALGTNSGDDPGFVNTDFDMPDLHLKADSSPCKDRGRKAGAPDEDHFGQIRDEMPDCGADEYGLP